MAQVIESVDVEVPVSTAYNQWTQFEDFPKFLDFVESITQSDDTHTHWRVNIGGADRESIHRRSRERGEIHDRTGRFREHPARSAHIIGAVRRFACALLEHAGQLRQFLGVAQELAQFARGVESGARGFWSKPEHASVELHGVAQIPELEATDVTGLCE